MSCAEPRKSTLSLDEVAQLEGTWVGTSFSSLSADTVVLEIGALVHEAPAAHRPESWRFDYQINTGTGRRLGRGWVTAAAEVLGADPATGELGLRVCFEGACGRLVDAGKALRIVSEASRTVGAVEGTPPVTDEAAWDLTQR